MIVVCYRRLKSSSTLLFSKNRAYLEELLQKERLVVDTSQSVGGFCQDDVRTLDLAKDNRILDLINTVERFTRSLLSNQDLLYLDVAKTGCPV